MICLQFLPVNTDFSLKYLAAKPGSGKLCIPFELSICYLLKYYAVVTIHLRGKRV